MANFSPPGLVFSPPPPWWAVSPPPPPPWLTRSPPPPPPWWARSPSFTADHSPTSSPDGLIAAVGILAAAIFLFVLISFCCTAARQSEPSAPEQQDNAGQQLRGAGEREGRRPRRAHTKAGLPSFTYTQSWKDNVSYGGGDDEAATCSVCLSALEVGETVRLLPVCLHLYHVECIDPWLDAHSTCPICRSGTVDEGPLPPV